MRILIISKSDKWVENLIPSFRSLGHEIEHIDLNRNSVKDVEDAFQRRPHFTFGSSFYPVDNANLETSLAVTDLSQKLQVPMALWMTDGPFTGSYLWRERFRSQSYPSFLKFFVIDSGHLEYFKKKGSDVFYLPLAAPETWKEFKPQPELQQKLKSEISFIGKPPFFTLQAPALSNDILRQIFSVLFTKEMNDLLVEIFVREKQSMSEANVGDLCGVFWEKLDALFLRGTDRPEVFDALKREYLLEISKSIPAPIFSAVEIWCDRLPMVYSYYRLSMLLRNIEDLNLRVFGGADWNFYLNRSDSAGRLSEEELKTLFAASDINLSYTKLHFMQVVPERVFWILAAGGFPLTDEREALFELFRPDEVGVYQDLSDVREKIAYYRDRPELRAKIIAAGRKHVFAEHTYKHRLATLVDAMSKFC